MTGFRYAWAFLTRLPGGLHPRSDDQPAGFPLWGWSSERSPLSPTSAWSRFLISFLQHCLRSLLARLLQEPSTKTV